MPAGYIGAFKLGTTAIAKITSWTGGGISREMLDSGYLGMSYDVLTYGPIHTDPVTASGWYDPTDATGQEVLRSYMLAGTALSDPRLYVDATHYFCLYDPILTTEPGSAVCYCDSVSSVTAEKGATTLCPISFTLRVSLGIFRYHT